MTKQEFIDTLGRALRRELSEQEVTENLQYYETYISQEMQKGKSESEVIGQLGDPRLIARTILEVDQQREVSQTQYYETQETVFTENPYGGYEESTDDDAETFFGNRGRVHKFEISRTKIWLTVTIVLLITFFILGTVFAILWRLLPIILVGMLLMWIYRKFFG